MRKDEHLRPLTGVESLRPVDRELHRIYWEIGIGAVTVVRLTVSIGPFWGQVLGD